MSIPRPGSGNPAAGASLWKKTPELTHAIRILIDNDTAGDPMSGVKWARKTPAKIAALLRQHGIEVSANTVARLLRQMDYSLRANRKSIASNSSPDRDRRFRIINGLRARFRRERQPIISVDTKKRELIGNFKNDGVKWGRTPVDVLDHDFRSDSSGVAIPYGVYDVLANRGAIFIGVTHDTPSFAAHSIAQWWRLVGSPRYPGARKILILADTGGSNGSRSKVWKTEIQTRLANQFQLQVTIAHYPTGASKWNPIEHRLFSEISKNWAAEPLTSYRKILGFIRSTVTAAGLSVSAFLNRRSYPTGVSADPDAVRQLRIKRGRVLPKWNYTISPAL